MSRQSKPKKHEKLTEINYRNNTESDYTETIEFLDKTFEYDAHSRDYWGQPELSLLYGTPLYEQASSTQKLALNHLYWATQYNQTAATEANAVLYNQVTAGVFGAFNGYDTLCQMLELETEQERSHIHAFHTIGYRTKRALLGKSAFNASILRKPGGKPKLAFNDFSNWIVVKNLVNSSLQEEAFRFFTHKVLLRHQVHSYSQYLKELEAKGEPIPAQTTGLLGQIAPRSALQFFTLNCGTSPFLACLFFLTRYMANMLLKNWEYRYVQFYRELNQKDCLIPAPTAVSYNHLMDESFHTTTSRLIAKDLYKDFPQPTAYEKLIANLTIYRAQTIGLSGLSGSVPATFRSDAAFILPLYRLLQSPVFDLSAQEAQIWLQQCLCQEHEGFHLNGKYHQHLLTELRQSFDSLDYLWPVNRELRIFTLGNNISQAIKHNRKVIEQFSRSLS
ncbi:MAG: hypothetical protein HC890_02345 [Chloroflexaceae bacterium]|nr:hypothetical protein [Chloroflexaceae bacterium]